MANVKWGAAPPPPPTPLWEGFWWSNLTVNTGFKCKVLQSSLDATWVCGYCGSHLIIFICNILSLQHPLRKSKLSFPFRLSLCLFLRRSPGCVESFSNFHLSSFGHQSSGLAYSLTTTRTIWIWVDSSLVVPLELSLVWVSLATGQLVQPPCLAITITIWSEWTQALSTPWSCLWPTLMQSSLLVLLSENHLIWVDLFRVSPLGLHAVCPLEFTLSFICRTVLDYLHIVCIYCYIITLCDNCSFILFFNDSILHH